MSKLDQLKALREAKASRKSSDGGGESRPAATPADRSGKPVAITGCKSDPARVAPGPSEIKLKRGRPKVQGPRPWETEGMSRRTWYRRQKEKAK